MTIREVMTNALRREFPYASDAEEVAEELLGVLRDAGYTVVKLHGIWPNDSEAPAIYVFGEDR